MNEPLMAPEFSSLVRRGYIDMREIEVLQRIFAECLAKDNLTANLNKEIDTVIDEVPCIVERRGWVSGRDE